MDFVCILIIVINISLRDMESLLAILKTLWDAEDVPDHGPIGNHLDTSDEDWLQSILAQTARNVHGNRRVDIRLHHFGQQ